MNWFWVHLLFYLVYSCMCIGHICLPYWHSQGLLCWHVPRTSLGHTVPEAFYFTKRTVNECWTNGERMLNERFVNGEQTLNERWTEGERWTENDLFIRKVSDVPHIKFHNEERERHKGNYNILQICINRN